MSWRYWVARKIVPNREKNSSMIPPDETLKRRSAKKLRSSMGWSSERSHSAKTVSRTTAMPKVRKDSGLSQPCSGASMMA